jgi:hypothetical protein
VGELLQPQRLEVAGQRRHHAEQQLGEVLRLDLDVGLLWGGAEQGRVRTRGRRVEETAMWESHTDKQTLMLRSMIPHCCR